MNSFLKWSLPLVLLCGLYFFSERQTQGFRFYSLLSDLPSDSRWETLPLSVDEEKKIDTLLSQSFTYLGSGGWCYAFLGQDGKTVLKFYKHFHLTPSSIVKNFSWDKLLLKSRRLTSTASYFQTFNFTSCMLLWERAKERTGLLYVHLNKTENKERLVTVFDPIGVKHVIDVNQTEFLLQEKAELLIPHFEHLIAHEQIDEAKRGIDEILACLTTLYQRGVRDEDASFRRNFGFVDGHAIALDISSFVDDPSVKDPIVYKREITLKTKRLAHFLKKTDPILFHHYQKRIEELAQ